MHRGGRVLLPPCQACGRSPRRKLICRYFENRKDTSKEDNDFLAAMKILEMARCLFVPVPGEFCCLLPEDKAFLDRVENKMKEKMKAG